jgi:myosin-5
VRRRKAIKELKVLKVEAKSVGKLKELNYKLENKVIELSQAVKSRDEEIKVLVEKVESLEGQATSWKEKFTRAETSSKAATAQLNEGSSEIKAELKAANEAKDALQKENEKLSTSLQKKETELEGLQSELAKSKEEVRKLKEDLKNAPKVSAEDSAVTANLRKEVASLKEQMSRLIAGKWTRDRVADSLLQNANENGYAFSNEATSARPSTTTVTATSTPSDVAVAIAHQHHLQQEALEQQQQQIAIPSRPYSFSDTASTVSTESRTSRRLTQRMSVLDMMTPPSDNVDNEVDSSSLIASLGALFLILIYRVIFDIVF